jgi:formate hydrogenlyase subunit 3/multisubunit Na+/H+ antiporter MnhD subunit
MRFGAIIFRMENNKQLRLGKINLVLLAVGFAIIVLGFALMTGSSTNVEFNPDIFSTRRITIGPMISFFGFIFLVFAILYKPKNK